ncbi:hypothetical protein [Luteolibacter soli]|uniref:Lipoprotein n=1 Tax=Luteolibacter soli TaxID=3135280 RepID=A0ABU9B4J9_9BACT
MNLWKATGWITCLLCSCGANVSQKLPEAPASTFCKVVEDTTSPDGRMAVAVGLNQAEPVDWSRYAERYDDQSLGFSFEPEELALANFLVDLKKDRAVDFLVGNHFGTRAKYNHESYRVAWSEDSKYLIEVQSWRLGTASARLYLLDGKAIASTMDLRPVVNEQLRIVAERNYKVTREKFEKSYEVTLWKQSVDSKGRVTLGAVADVFKSEDDPSVSIQLRFTAKAGKKGELSAENVEVMEKDEEAE